MATHLVTATEAARSFSEILNRVKYQGLSFDVRKGAVVMARIIPAGPERQMKLSELAHFLEHLPGLNPEEMDAFLQDVLAGKHSLEAEHDPWE